MSKTKPRWKIVLQGYSNLMADLKEMARIAKSMALVPENREMTVEKQQMENWG